MAARMVRQADAPSVFTALNEPGYSQNTLDKDSLLSCGLLSGATIDPIQEENTAVDSCEDINNVVASNVGPAVYLQHSLVTLA
jgi:hypothetical protein